MIIYGIFLNVLALAVGLSLCTLGYRWSRHDGYEAGYMTGKADRAEDDKLMRDSLRKAAQVPRHARTQPRATLPIPGPPKPQPGRDSGDGTLTMAKLELPATTGEMAAVTDQYLADMAVQEEQFRLGLAT